MQNNDNNTTARRHSRIGSLALAFTMVLCALSHANAQPFDSGSNGSDGALNVPTNQGTILFDPADVGRWGKVLDPDGDAVYHFTTISIGSGSSLRLRGDMINKPVHFLATGAVVINGDILLHGEPGTGTNQLVLRRAVPIPGAGGYAGGAGGLINGAAPPTPGEGPGGGSGGVTGGNCVNGAICGRGGAFTGNRYLVPMIGGSGGEGARWNTSDYFSGGAGGGAFLLASSVSIAINATINATGGNGGNTVGGGGSGGAIRFVAPVLTGSGQFQVRGGTASFAPAASQGTSGWVRLEGFQISTTLTFNPDGSVVTRGAPVDTTSLQPSGSIRVTAIAGVAVPIYSSGSFSVPDVSINTATPVNVNIEAIGIPPGTVVTLRVYPDTPEDLGTINLPEVTATLQGTTQLSTATVQFSFPYGFSKGYVRASWTQ